MIGSNFYDYQCGVTFGGPIVKDKLFFFVNGEITRRQEPTFYNADEQGAAITSATAQQIINHLKSAYNYDPGSYGPTTIQTNSNKLFFRADWNINKNNSFMLRGIYTDGSGQNLERTSTNFQFSTTDFTQHTKNTNIVSELKSTINKDMYNSAIVSFINVHEYRNFPGTLAPFIDIGGGQIWLGTWREASVYNTNQKTFELTDNFTWKKGINKFTFGTHNELYNIDYRFINSYNGRWEYASVASFLADEPSRIRGAYAINESSNTRNNLYDNAPGSNFSVNLFSVYAQDEVNVNSRIKITGGLRMDYPQLPKQPELDSNISNTTDYVNATGNSSYSHTAFKSFTDKWLGQATISPRVGFNIDVKGDQSFILRGGSGIFVGRMPFAWLGYAYTLSGSEYGNIDYKPGGKTVGLAVDPAHLLDTVKKYGGTSASATHEVDIVDNNFKLPTAWRLNIAADIKLGAGYRLTLDAMYTKTVYDVKFQQINLKDTFTYLSSGPNQTPVYLGGKVNSAFSNVYLLSNTTEGYRYNLTAQLSKAFTDLPLGSRKMNIYSMVAYTYGMSQDVSNGIRNSFQSNYEVNPAINPENAKLSYSNFDLRHRIVASANFNFPWSKTHATNVTFFYSGASGNPYSLIYNSSPNAFNNSSNATLVYIPKDQNDIHLADVKTNGVVTYSAAQQWTDLSSFIEGDNYLKNHKGQYADRNALRTPWNHELDMRIMHEFRFNVGHDRTNSIQLSLDVFNVLNLIDHSAGHQTFVTNVNNYTVNFLKAVNDASNVAPGKANWTPTYNFNTPPNNGHYYTEDPISSRWQAQFGIKYIF